METSEKTERKIKVERLLRVREERKNQAINCPGRFQGFLAHSALWLHMDNFHPTALMVQHTLRCPSGTTVTASHPETLNKTQ